MSFQYNVHNGAYIDTRYYNALLSYKVKEIKLRRLDFKEYLIVGIICIIIKMYPIQL